MPTHTCKTCGWSGHVNGRRRCLECCRKKTREWRKANPDAARQQRRDWEKKFRTERPAEYNARRRLKRSKERMREANQKRRAWLDGGDVTAEQLLEIHRASNGRCVYCGETVKCRFTPTDPRGFDHVQPRARGGTHTASNIVVSCAQCNAVKADR